MIEQLRSFYENEGDEELRLRKDGAHYLEYLTMSRYLRRYLNPKSRVLDNCAGTGVYAFDLAAQGHIVTAGDLLACNVDAMHRKQAENPVLAGIYRGDALALSGFDDASFDAVLCMGALYHLTEPADRRRAIDEGLRVLRPGGLLFCTYMNRYAVILNNTRGAVENIDEILAFAGDGKEGIFYTSTPEESEDLFTDCGVGRVCHIALDGVSNYLYTTTGLIDRTGLERWYQYHFVVCEAPSLLGYSYHNLLIGRKMR